MYDNRFNPNFQFQPSYPQQQMFSQRPMQLVRVNGIEGARAYQMPANSTVALFDSGSDVMYIKQSDGAGFPTIRTFTFTEQTQKPLEQRKDTDDGYVTRTEFDKMKQKIDRIEEGLKHGEQPVPANANKR